MSSTRGSSSTPAPANRSYSSTVKRYVGGGGNVLGCVGVIVDMIPPFDLELLNILCCPETHQKLQLAAPPILEKLNQQIAAGSLHNRAGRALDEKVAAGLVRADGVADADRAGGKRR